MGFFPLPTDEVGCCISMWLVMRDAEACRLGAASSSVADLRKDNHFQAETIFDPDNRKAKA
jgi:hypothetical protein